MSAGERPPIEPELVPAAVAGLATPGAILTRMRNVDADVRALDGEIQAQRARVPAAFLRGWAHWRDAWRRFYGENEGFMARAWPGTLAEVEAFARRLRDWRSASERAGAQLATPEPGRPPPPPPPPRLPTLPDLLPSIPIPDLSPLRDLARALPNPARILEPARELLQQGPLSARFWENVRPVAMAGAWVVGGLALVWVLNNMRIASGGVRIGSNPAQQADLERLVPMLATRGLVR